MKWHNGEIFLQALILHTNQLESLTDNGNKLENLYTLLVLDLHSNKLTKIPTQIRCLAQLQVRVLC